MVKVGSRGGVGRGVVMRGLTSLIVVVGLSLASPAAAVQTASGPPPASSTPSPVGSGVAKDSGTSQASSAADTRPFGFTHVLMKLPAGQEWLSMHAGIFCFGGAKQTWNGGQQEQKVGPYMDVLRPQMQGAGFKVDGDPDNVFEQTASTADLQLAAVINDFYLDVCLPMVGYGNSSTIKGSANMRVQWQLYSTIQKTVVARIDTVGEAHFKDATQGGVAALTMAAFKDNVNSLAASATFRTALAGAPNGGGQTAKPTAQAVIPLLGALTAKSRPVSDTVGAVVLIFAGEAQGSGFLVSADGLMMTDHHVVGDAKYVKVRWPDGIETLGEVIRSDKVRDVALIKTDPRGRQPIRIRAAPLQPGDTVFAIGAPLDPKFQSTVTRGVVSAYRTFEGLSYIQSDVSVNPGSSGGPLLDDSGEVIGMTESGFHVAGAPSGINLFIPISDALDFVNASPK